MLWSIVFPPLYVVKGDSNDIDVGTGTGVGASIKIVRSDGTIDVGRGDLFDLIDPSAVM